MADPLSGAGHNRGPLGNMTQLQALEFLDRYADVDEEVKQALARRKQLRDEIEAAGCPKPAWDRFKKDRELSGVLRERFDAAYRQLMLYDRKPMNFSVAAADDPNADPAVRQMATSDLKRIDTEGFEAGKSGHRRDRNTYTPGTQEYARWDTAWVRGQAEIASSMGPGAGGENGVKRGRGRPKSPERLAKEAAAAEKARAAEAEGSADKVH